MPPTRDIASVRWGEAPGRLDLLGGVADYGGALVLETPTRVRTVVEVTPAATLGVGDARYRPEELAALATRPYPEIRAELAAHARWTHYSLGVVLVLVRHGVIDPPTGHVAVRSEVPIAVGVSSSAAIEVATARAFGVSMPPLDVARWCQEAENEVVGAPCGVMDQVVVSVGRPGEVLPIRCRTVTVDPGIVVPPTHEVVGVPTGETHDVSGQPYRVARTAAHMGKVLVEAAAGRAFDWLVDLPEVLVAQLPDWLDGADFLDQWGGTADPLTAVEPDVVYPVRAAAGFAAAEHRRAQAAVAHLGRAEMAELGPLMAASHAGYDAMGLGHAATDVAVEWCLEQEGVLGARSSGGGSGGTVVAVCRRGALDHVTGLVR